MLLLLGFSPKVPVSLYVYEEHWGATIPIAKVEGNEGVVLKTEGSITHYCEVEVPDSILDPERWKALRDSYRFFQGTDLPTYHFVYRAGDFEKHVITYGPPNISPFLGSVFSTLTQAECRREVVPKRIVLSWEEVFVKRRAAPMGEYERLLGKREVKGEDLKLAYSMLKRFGHDFFTGVILMDSKGRTWLVKGEVSL
ncbi:MAG: hypothetical protein GXO29_01740 [Thermotogae bacterium]|nr:hypothetical protein [Thermotogota bacterium]